MDRMAVIVGKHVIKTSDIVRDLRVTEFLNREPLELGSDAKRKSAERLIDQEIIRQEIVSGGYRRPSDEEGTAFEKQLEKDRFHGSSADLRASAGEIRTHRTAASRATLVATYGAAIHRSAISGRRAGD